MTTATPRPAVRMHPSDLARTAGVGLRTRRMRAALSALGIAIGVAAMVAVLGLSSSSQAGLLSEIDKLGTNLLKVTPGQTLSGEDAKLPTKAPSMIDRLDEVEMVQSTGATEAQAYRNQDIPAVNTNALTVTAASLELPEAVRTGIAEGRYLNAATSEQPVAVLGSAAASRLGFSRVHPGTRIRVGGQWFYVVGILEPAALTPEINSSVLVGYQAARKWLNFDGYPTTIYVRAATDHVADVQKLLAATTNPTAPGEVSVTQPSAALEARAAAESALNGLFLGLGAVALLVGGIGVANTMVISVLERRSEIGLRRALGATKGHIRLQFLSEAVLLSALGGLAGVALGAASTIVYAQIKGWTTVVPPLAWGGGLIAAVVIGAVAGLLPALRAARMQPTEALRTA
ncbi:ABC transporter permease [Streptomyces sp. NPDC088812]|uniref:ABC transporter permease n=1 Tax=Streptomyces sp. NPDC088812 TaxID=3365905 RepID=UPI00382088E2